MSDTSHETLHNAGQITIDAADIVSTNGIGFSVINQIAQIDLYEDLFSPFMTGTINLYESLDLLNLFPMVGEEMITLAFHTPTLDKIHYRKQQFYIYKMSDMTTVSDKGSVYVLHFMSVEAVVNLNTRISRTFSGRISDIATSIIKDVSNLHSAKDPLVEITKNSTKFTANYWSPMKCLNYLTGTAININNSPSYMFFENSHGLNFLTLDSLYALDSQHNFNQNNYTRDVNSATGTAVKEVMKDYAKIKDFSIPHGFDYIDRCMGGMYGSQLITTDPITKKYSSKNYAGIEDYTKYNHLNTNSLMSNKTIARSQQAMIYLPKHYGNFNGFVDVTNATSIQRRTSILKQAEAFKVMISVSGRTDYTVGVKVELSIQAKESLDIKDTKSVDFVASGFYLISAIHHKISRISHEVDMELIKDSLLVDINKGTK